VDLSEAAFSKFRDSSSNFTSDNKFSYTVSTEYQGTNEIHFWKLEADGTFGKQSKETYECGQVLLSKFSSAVDQINMAEGDLTTSYYKFILSFGGLMALCSAPICNIVAAGFAFGLTMLEVKQMFSYLNRVESLERDAEGYFSKINEYSSSEC